MTIASEALAKRIRPLLARRQGIIEKKMFGGICFMLHGNMAVCTMANGDLLVRIDQAKADAALARSGAFVRKMGEREMTGYVGVAPRDVADVDELKRWVMFGFDHARTLPPK
jgi:TfoX/Sxy family transcriptional regulator of competence genes